jgi:hypothetical protein
VVRRHYPPWVSPFGHRRIKAWLAAPRRFSQLPTSFFASCRLGIHRVPFVAWSSLFLLLHLHREDQGPARPVVNRCLPDDTFLPTCAYAVVKDRHFLGDTNRRSAAHHVPDTVSWWSRSGSNRRHPACKAGALPAELRPRYRVGDMMSGAAAIRVP